MDFSYSEDQEALRELARKILEEQVTHDRLKEIEATEEHTDRQVWAELAKSNLLGVPFSETHGGSGMGLSAKECRHRFGLAASCPPSRAV